MAPLCYQNRRQRRKVTLSYDGVRFLLQCQLNDVVITGTFSINSYKVTFMYGDNVLKTITVEYGAAIPLPTSLDSERYTLVEWLEVPTTMPAHDVTIRANYVDGISMVQNDGKSARRIQLNGISSNTPMKGIYIIRMGDGSTKKVMVK